MKKEKIITTATRLFATQGFDGTTTLQITKEAGATEPLLYHHFKGKDELYTLILKSAFKEYFSRLDKLPKETATQFEKIEKLIDFHFKFLKKTPNETYLIFSSCPAKLIDPEHVCAENIVLQSKRLTHYLTECLKGGLETGEFVKVPVTATVELLIATINGLLRQHSLQLENVRGLQKTVVEFCRRSLIHNKSGER